MACFPLTPAGPGFWLELQEQLCVNRPCHPHGSGDVGVPIPVWTVGCAVPWAVGGEAWRLPQGGEEHAAERANPGVTFVSSCSSCCFNKQPIFVYNTDRHTNFNLTKTAVLDCIL